MEQAYTMLAAVKTQPCSLAGNLSVVRLGDQSTGRKQGLARGLWKQGEGGCQWMFGSLRPAPLLRKGRCPFVCSKDTPTVQRSKGVIHT